MASESRRQSPDLSTQLTKAPYRFSFFQAVRLIERAAETAQKGDFQGRRPVGEDYAPQEEAVRFRTLVSFAFPAGEIASFQAAKGKGEGEGKNTPPELVAAFLGLTGPAGVLPQHYTQLLIDRVRRKDHSLRDFFDVFHHRLISLFYRAWRKYRFFVDYERTASTPQAEEDLFTFCLYSLVGLGTSHLRRRQLVDDETLLFYGGHFAHAPRNAISLEAILNDYLGVPVVVVQFVGQWLYLEREDQTCFPSLARRDGCNNDLGQRAIAGSRVWGMENKVRIRLGPLSFQDFLRYTPRGDLLSRAAQLVRSYVGPEFDFDLQPVLKAKEVPPCQLGGEGAQPYLGWTTWLCSVPKEQDADDAKFSHEGWPEGESGV
jgi:type VI secretion system protein ImpH